MSSDVLVDLAPTGVLRAGINLSNFLLVTKMRSTGDPEGVAPDLAHEVATRLDVPIK
jgi:polar amino acid transport system substrate-binding protein